MLRNDTEEERREQPDAAPSSSGILDTLQEQFGSAPWWLISTAIHVCILAVLTLIVMAYRERETEQIIITTHPPQKKPLENILDRSMRPSQKQVTLEEIVDDPLLVHYMVELDERMEIEDEMEAHSSRGEPELLSDIPLGGPGVVGNIGVSGGVGGYYSSRIGRNRRRNAMRCGGNPGSESAVEAALRWLSRHQEQDGRWDGEKYGGKNTDAGLTGLALLAFLGAGHTERAGKYRNVVRNAVRWIIAQQDASGAIGKGFEHGLGYHHAICGVALAEAYGMARLPSTGRAAQKAIDYSCDVHQKAYSGWRYRAKQAPDLSVTGWFVMQLKSARVARLKVAGSGFQGAIQFLDQVTDDKDYGGRCSYQPGRAVTHTMTSVGVLCRQFLGFQRHEPVVQGGAQYLMEALPQWGAGNANVNFYYWYYGTLVMFQMRGEHWKAWNGAMRDMLVGNQRKGGDEDGSWDPVGTWCARGGRVFSTAMGALCLEVYYRYLPIYKGMG